MEQVRADDMLAYLVAQAHRLNASDIHLENQVDNVRIRLRIMLVETVALPAIRTSSTVRPFSSGATDETATSHIPVARSLMVGSAGHASPCRIV